MGPFARDGTRLLITSKKGWYVVDVAGAAREQVLTLKEGDEANPRMDALDWSPDGQALYLTWSERDRWERGLVRMDVATKALVPLVKDARLYSGFRQTRDGRRFVFTLSDGDRPGDLQAASSDFASAGARRLTDLNPWMAAKALPKSELGLVSRRRREGAVRRAPIPGGLRKGKRYPTVFEIYETFFDNGFNGRAAFLANHGYAVFHPSVNLVVGRPGESWEKGVTAAANRLIDMGVADPDRLGVHGTSYGGYATVLLLTADRPVQGRHQHLGQGGHGQLLYGQPAARRPQHPCAREEPGPHRRHVVGIPGALPGTLGRPARGSHHDAAPVHHRRPGPERAREPVAGDLPCAAPAREGGGMGALRRRRPPAAEQRGRKRGLRAAHSGVVREVSEGGKDSVVSSQ
ncbi:MAG: prolyl oligopeptidase family serine peptidase [Comamonadaceae bacterium]|nr:prolyl oligopeptidase family serine peptidase [Comamonadaceae bacterium]